MTITFEFRPHEGFGPARLDADRAAVREAMASIGFPLEATHGRSDYFCESSVQVEFTDGRSSFIGVACSDKFRAVYRGTEVFELTAPELHSRIAAADDTGPHSFDAHEHYFPGQVMTLYDADQQYDYRGNFSREVWSQVGLGSRAYAEARNGDA
ncbi:hypothetical protein [Usitatibacter rugosus]|nr:hypothetical protein [Usitatibacter rugosus]